jgi:DNA-binding response OmpR family regulator
MLQKAAALNPVAIFVDVHLDKENGLNALPDIRSLWRNCPIIVITADPAEEPISEALTRGADDFILKPLRPREIVARVQARLADHSLKQASHSLEYGDLKLDQTHRLLRGPKGEHFLSPTELNLLASLMRGAGTTLERATLKNQCWDHIVVSDNALDRKVFEVRKALLDVGSHCAIGTAYGIGFFLELPPSSLLGLH